MKGELNNLMGQIVNLNGKLKQLGRQNNLIKIQELNELK